MKIRVLIKRPDSGWYTSNISNTLENMQKTVGGHIQAFPLATDCCLICNEEGRLLGLPYNCTLLGIDFVGTIFLCGMDGEDFCDCPISLKRWKELNQKEV